MSTPSDAKQRAAARRIQAGHPHWHITWGLHSRKFWAYPLFNADPGTLIQATDTSQLLALMQQVETAAGYVSGASPGWATPPDPPGPAGE